MDLTEIGWEDVKGIHVLRESDHPHFSLNHTQETSKSSLYNLCSCETVVK